MSDQVLTENEVDALLDGVESGEIEVQSADGPRYASVKAFEIPRRSHIQSERFPVLELLNARFAESLRIRSQQLLHCDLDLVCSQTTSASFGDVRHDFGDALVAVEFEAAPLNGRGAILFEADLVHQLVEVFFGGNGGEPKESAINGFTVGELRVISAYSKIFLKTLKETWESIQTIDPVQQKMESSIQLVDIADDTHSTIKCTFELSFDDHSGALHMLLPFAMVKGLMPVFTDTDRKEDPQQDEEWAELIRTGLADVAVNLSTNVGYADMTLRDLISLEPGDIIDINNPSVATILVQDVALLEGRFGVHAGQNAVETTRWLHPDQNDIKRDGTHG